MLGKRSFVFGCLIIEQEKVEPFFKLAALSESALQPELRSPFASC